MRWEVAAFTHGGSFAVASCRWGSDALDAKTHTLARTGAARAVRIAMPAGEVRMPLQPARLLAPRFTLCKDAIARFKNCRQICYCAGSESGLATAAVVCWSVH